MQKLKRISLVLLLSTSNYKAKVIKHKSRGEVSLVEQDQRASGDELRAAIDVGRKQYQPKQLK
jgi:hypothetical protein